MILFNNGGDDIYYGCYDSFKVGQIVKIKECIDKPSIFKDGIFNYLYFNKLYSLAGQTGTVIQKLGKRYKLDIAPEVEIPMEFLVNINHANWNKRHNYKYRKLRHYRKNGELIESFPIPEE